MTKQSRPISYIVTIRRAIPSDLTRKLAEAHFAALRDVQAKPKDPPK